ncbi:MAG: hypothetical protein KDE19_11790 [Caldilineaceae bacterium]|nr:hypothetical protein [Caldilineaceae bacterium]
MLHKRIVHASAIPATSGWAFLLVQPFLLLGLLLWLMAGNVEPVQAQSCSVFPDPQQRFGFNVARDGGRHIDDYNVSPLHAHWYLDYFAQEVPSQPNGMVYAQMIRSKDWQPQKITETLTMIDAIVANNPGTLWILGNEPDRDKQDGQTPAEYAVFYHELYHAIKERDPNSRIAIGGVVQPTPLRRHYLDLVLAAYQSRYGTVLPVDVWNIHAFILREEKKQGSWGASLPPGMDEFAAEGKLYEVWEHDNQAIFQENILAFRQWMADNGYRDKPLVITEYGILLSPLHGFPYEKVRDFMTGSFDYFLSATDAEVGYPADGNRLVQAWSWFSLNYPPYDPETNLGHNGNLLTPQGGLLALGQDYGQYIAALAAPETVQLSYSRLRMEPSYLVTPTTATPGGTIPTVQTQFGSAAQSTWPPTLTLESQLRNSGTAAGCNIQVELWHQAPDGERMLVEQRQLATLAAASSASFNFTWQPDQLTVGAHRFIVRSKVDNGAIGLPIAEQEATYTLLVLTEPLTNYQYLPTVQR